MALDATGKLNVILILLIIIISIIISVEILTTAGLSCVWPLLLGTFVM